MVNKNLFLGFIPLLFLSVVFLLSSKNLFFMWACMELNMLSVLPLLSSTGEGFQSEVVLKYFLVQAWGSLIFIWSVMSAMKLALGLYSVSLSLALFLKLGAAPLHLWFISIMKVLDWKTFVIMSTVQKAIPLHILFLLQAGGLLKLGVAVGCLASASVGSLKFLKKVMAISSVFSLAWLFLGGLGNSSLWIIYLAIYTLGLISVVSALDVPVESGSLVSMKDCSWSLKLNVFLGFMVLAGLPPLVGFFGKLLLFSYGLALGELGVCMALLVGSVWMMYVYVRSSYPLLTSGEVTDSAASDGQFLSAGWGFAVISGSLLITLSLGLWTGVIARKILNFKVLGDT